MIDASRYSIEIRRGNFEGEDCFQARVKEIPYLEEYADSYEEAYGLVIDSIEQTAIEMEASGKVMPPPIVSVGDYSGRVTLRLPKTLHRYLTHVAESEDVSLNSLMISVLSDFHGFDVGQDATSKGYYQTVAMSYAVSNAHVERKKVRQSSLRIVGGNTYSAPKAA
ncbi:toxin-antitoxin system HicB family antitoxin [Pseudomonas fluorescens]|uniref:toxin-antitoxin system HicB family antitoxin n=1 Tax=Pseudomonas fluorescens TaxID=294 RepID=UPI001242E461|nr:toxin-antitoxin system HicB family antitoxin [Pseudomonas fluorescens]